jgi:hypothetical protein
VNHLHHANLAFSGVRFIIKSIILKAPGIFIPFIEVPSPDSVFHPGGMPHGTFICQPAGLRLPLYNHALHKGI